MNLIKMFEMQKVLDDHIMNKHPIQKGEDRLSKKILSLLVELGELANELPEVFKFWSYKKNDYKKALKEYVDCLHFILSIGNELNLQVLNLTVDSDYTRETTTKTFNELFRVVTELESRSEFGDYSDTFEMYEILLNTFIGLGELCLGFTWEEIEQAYFTKNAVNHQRQEDGY